MNGMKTIFEKELTRIFKDKKMVFSVFFLPVLIMVGIMGLMSNMMDRMEDDIDSHKPVVYIENETESFGSFLAAGDYDYDINEITSSSERKAAEKKILSGEADLLIAFPESFDQAINEYEDGDEVPQVKTYYNPSEDYSAAAYNEISGQVLEGYRQMLLSSRMGNLEQIAVFTVNSDNEDMVIQDDEKAGGKALGMMLPYFVTILLFAGAMGIGTDMIAGEKERGTMASLLMSPAKRSSIALGKVFALMTLAGLSSLISVAGMVIGMPLMMKSMTGGSQESLSLTLNISQIAMLGAMLIALAFLYSTIIALLSVFAKNTKEASTYVMPIYMLVLVVGLMSMFGSGTPSESAYLIPIYNSSVVLKEILAREITVAHYGITLGITVGISLVLIGVIVKAFESEKVMSA